MLGRGEPMPGRWTAAAYTCLMVALYVAEPAIVNLTVHDHVQLDEGTSAHVLAVAQANGKDDPPEHMMARALPAAMGDSPPDHVPTLTILR